jgi:hypothetical protein
MALTVFFGVLILGWVIKKLWEQSWKRRTGRPANELWEAPKQPEPHPRVYDEATVIKQAGLPPTHAPKAYRD